MIGLDSEKWGDLQGAYGSAYGVPDILRRLYANPTDKDALNDAWSTLCHQSTIYSASVAAAPHLVALTVNLHLKDRLGPLILAGSIAANLKTPPNFIEADEHFDESRRLAIYMLTETIQYGGLVYEDLRYSLAALAAYLGDSKLSQTLFNLDSEIQCPNWGEEIDLLQTGEVSVEK